MLSPPSTPERCRSLLSQWRSNLALSKFEETQLAGDISILDTQLKRLMLKQLRIAVFGRVGVGKSSLLNALIGKQFFSTDVAHGCTRRTEVVKWNQQIDNLKSI